MRQKNKTTGNSIENQSRATLSWADIAKTGIDERPDELHNRFIEFKKGLSSIRPRPEPDITEAYVIVIPRCPISTLKRNLRKCLPSWAVLSIDFIGNTTEILCHKLLAHILTSTLTVMGFKLVPILIRLNLGDKLINKTSRDASTDKRNAPPVRYVKEWYDKYADHLRIKYDIGPNTKDEEKLTSLPASPTVQTDSNGTKRYHKSLPNQTEDKVVDISRSNSQRTGSQSSPSKHQTP